MRYSRSNMRFLQRFLALSIFIVSTVACSPSNGDKGTGQSPAAARGNARADTEAVLNVYSWADYIAPEVVRNFTRETGIKVNYQEYENDQVLERKLLVGTTEYDVVVPSGPFFARLLKAAEYRKLDKTALPNLKNLDPVIYGRLAKYDPGNLYAVPYLWNSTGVAYNVAAIRQRFGPKPPDSWALIFDPSNAAKLQDCGIAVVESPIEVIASASLYLGIDPHRLAAEDFDAAAGLLRKIRPYVRYTGTSQILDELTSGAICVAITWSGDGVQANERAKAAHNGVEVAYFIPKEGALISVDMMSIMADAPHPHNALLWLDYLMRPEVMASISNYTKYPNGNAASLPLLDPAVRNNPATYPDGANAARLTESIAATTEWSLKVNREWARFQANYR